MANQRQRDRVRGTAQRGYGAKWCKLRDGLIAEHPYYASRGATSKLSVDHIVPTTPRRTGDPGNLRVLCMDCNCGRPDKAHDHRAQASQTTR